MVEIAPTRIDSRTEQGYICDTVNNVIQFNAVIYGCTVLLFKGMATIHLKSKCSTIICHIVLDQLQIIDGLVSKLTTPFYGKLVNEGSVIHCGTPPSSNKFYRFLYKNATGLLIRALTPIKRKFQISFNCNFVLVVLKENVVML